MNGQIDGRRERLQKTAEWLNAVPVDGDGQELLDTVKPIDFRRVGSTVFMIRSGLAAGSNIVNCNISDPATVQAVKDQLTEDELARTAFH